MAYWLNSPIFTGNPQAPTPTTADNSTSVATTAFVKAQGYGAGTVTAVSVASTNGISATSSGGATPSLTISLGAITPTSVNGIIHASLSVGFTLAGGTTSKTLQVNKTVTLDAAGDGNTLNIGTGGTLGSAAYTPSTNYVLATAVGAANGVAGLDSGGKVPLAQLPASITGALNYQGVWNANTNSPALATGVGTKGYYYKVGTAGTTLVDGNSSWSVGDIIAFDGTTWDKIDGDPTVVTSVNGSVGAVTVAAVNQSFYLGTTQLAINAGTGTQTVLAGMTSITSTTFVGNLTGNASGSAASITGNLTGDVTSVGMATTLTAATILAKLLAGYTAGSDSSVLAATDTILQAFQKLQYQDLLGLETIVTKTTTYNPTVITDKTILCDATAGAFAITLLAAPVNGQVMSFKKIDSTANAITINGNGKNIDGAGTFSLPAQWNAVTLKYNGTAWYAF